jgi:hypothetical protein
MTGTWFGCWMLQELIQDIMGLMRGIALHNTLLIHQHSARRMDGGPHSPPDPQPPPAGFYQNILVRFFGAEGRLVHVFMLCFFQNILVRLFRG